MSSVHFDLCNNIVVYFLLEPWIMKIFPETLQLVIHLSDTNTLFYSYG